MPDSGYQIQDYGSGFNFEQLETYAWGRVKIEAIKGPIKDLKWPEENNVFRGTDSLLCDLYFSNWDWVANQRARELGLGIKSPADLQLVFDEKGSPFMVSSEKREWIAEDSLRPPKYEIG